MRPVLEPKLDRHLEVFAANAEEILPREELVRKLERALATRRPLRIKQGFDPTAPDIHLGHAVGLRKLRDLQALGHTIVLIVGDYTAQVGDPSGRSKTRPSLSAEEVERNAATYLRQFFRVLRQEGTEIRRNGEWFARMTFADLLRLASQYTVARILERDDFARRVEAHEPIGVHELLYPLMQGRDSVEIRADVEIGGTEQKFNLLVGRALQEAEGQEPQVVLTVPILVGLDGVQRMSKSLGNYVGVEEPAADQFGKLMSIPDAVLGQYWQLAADLPPGEAGTRIREVETGRVHPMESKKQLAERVVTLFHGAEAAAVARAAFERQFSLREAPQEAFEWTLPTAADEPAIGIKDVLVLTQLARSGSEAWRKIQEGAVSVDGKTIQDKELRLNLGPGEAHLIRLGRRWVLARGDARVTRAKRSHEPVPVPGASPQSAPKT
jgi:tyrosyl-tRNA synthetase